MNEQPRHRHRLERERPLASGREPSTSRRGGPRATSTRRSRRRRRRGATVDRAPRRTWTRASLEAVEPEPEVERRSRRSRTSPNRRAGAEAEIARTAIAVAPSLEHAAGDLRDPGGIRGARGRRRRRPARRRRRRLALQRQRHVAAPRRARSRSSRLRACAARRSRSWSCPARSSCRVAATALAKTRRFACIVALGCVIRGDTPHFDYVASEAASGLQLAALETGVPVSFGVLTLDRVEQAEPRDREGRRGRAQRARDGRRLLASARGSRVAGLQRTRQALARCDTALAPTRRYHARPHVQGLRDLREEARLRQQPEPLDGRHASVASTRTCSASACCSKVTRRAPTSARAASRPARSRKRSRACATH